jgi:two-component system LytT family sensor kinase
MGRRILLLILAFWTLFGALTASNWLLSPVGQEFPYPERLVVKAFFYSYVWALLTPPVLWLAVRLNPEYGARVRRGFLLLMIGLGVGFLAAVVEAVGYLWVILPDEVEYANDWDRTWALTRSYFPSEVVTFLVVLGAGLISDISRRYRARERESIELQARTSRLEAEQAELRARAAQLQAQSAELHAQLAEARLAMLRTQLNPHLLFNTLNAVSALVAKDPRGVRDMIALLSELLRYALKDSTEQEIPLREELRLLRIYLEILEIRYQGQLQTLVAVDTDAQEALVPALIMQPLVENAMKHGIERAGGYGTIEVRARRSGDDLLLSVQDTGSGDEVVAPGADGSGVGLRLTRARLVELYGSEQRLELQSVPDGGMIAQIMLPYHTSEDVRIAAELSQS